MDIHKEIGRLPKPKRGFTLPGHKYTGPYNPLDKQLDTDDLPIPGQEPFNAVDAISMKHDICYRDNKNGKRKCDDQMVLELDLLKPKNIRERIDRNVVRNIISAKSKLGVGIEWTNQLANELHKPIRRKFRKRSIFAREVDDIWAADLVDMQSLSRVNNGYKYILMVIDVLSKYAWSIPLKSKTGVEVTNAFKRIFARNKPRMLWVDHGKEFYNKSMEQLLKKNSIKKYSTNNEEKASVVERFNRTIKTWMWKYFSSNNTKKYVDILDKLITRYNNTKHRAIGCTPLVARQPSSYQCIFNSLYGHEDKRKTQTVRFHHGDKVRISKRKKTFEKGFTPNWTEELFRINEVQKTKPTTYTIQDMQGDPIKGSFYDAELQKASQKVYRIEKVIRKRTRKGGEQEALVKSF